MLSYKTSLASLTLLLSIGCGASTTDPTDTNTSWLATCGSDSDCSSDFSCLCGVCTLSCSSNSQCNSASRSAVCDPVEGTCGDAQRTCQRARTEDRGADGSIVVPRNDAGRGGTDETIATDSTSSDGAQLDAAAPETSATSSDAGPEPGDPVICSISESSAIDVQMVCLPGSSCCGCGCYSQPECPTDAVAACDLTAFGPVCGDGYCSQPDDVCCDAEAGLCAKDAASCPGGVAESTVQTCVPMIEGRNPHVHGRRWSGSVQLLQAFRGETKSTTLDVTLEFTSYGLPLDALPALGYLGDWHAGSDALRENQGLGTAWAYNQTEADGPGNELAFEASCFNAPARRVDWTYEVDYWVVDLIDYQLYDYDISANRERATLSAHESYEWSRDDDQLVLIAEANGEAEDGSPLTFSVTGTLTPDE